MAITYVGSASAASNSVALPSFQPDDIALVLAVNGGSTTAPTLPSGWNQIDAAVDATGAQSAMVASRLLQSGDTTIGSWGAADRVGVVVYRGGHQQLPIDNKSLFGVTSGTSASILASAAQTSSTSVALLMTQEAATNTRNFSTPQFVNNRTAALPYVKFGSADTTGPTVTDSFALNASDRTFRVVISLRDTSTFPQVSDLDTTTGTVTGNSSSWTLTYPTNLQAGDLILALVAMDGGGVSAGASATGFTEMRTINNVTTCALTALGRISDGTETGTFSATIGQGSEQGAWRVLRIVGWYGSGLAVDAGSNPTDADGTSLIWATGVSNQPDPASADPANWGTEDTLWIAAIGVDTSRTVSAYPSNMTSDNGSLVSGGSNGATLAWARTESAVASLDPGTFTISSSDDWAALTIAIRPAAGAPPATGVGPAYIGGGYYG